MEMIRHLHKGTWFDPKTMKFFRTKLSDYGYVGKVDGLIYFVTSEECLGCPRFWSVRRLNRETGYIDTCGTFNSYQTAKDARNAARHMALTGETPDES